jgi:hypothetical protein
MVLNRHFREFIELLEKYNVKYLGSLLLSVESIGVDRSSWRLVSL